ncbi:MAG: pth [Chlamydiales bacterium]|nr:pth [Chlamydiales bacterium]
MEQDLLLQPKLIVGLGNPGTEYALTRHNLGYLAVTELAKKYQLKWQKEKKLQGYIAKGQILNHVVCLLLPTTYMNLSGQSVQACLRFFRIPQTQLLVISDEIAIPFGKIRLRLQGSAGGHNGLKNIEHMLGTQIYCRLRMGIGSPAKETLEDYVLNRFSSDEQSSLPDLISQGVKAIEIWLTEATETAMNIINLPPTKPKSPPKQAQKLARQPDLSEKPPTNGDQGINEKKEA